MMPLFHSKRYDNYKSISKWLFKNLNIVIRSTEVSCSDYLFIHKGSAVGFSDLTSISAEVNKRIKKKKSPCLI